MIPIENPLWARLESERTAKELVDQIINSDDLIAYIVSQSKDTENSTLWAYFLQTAKGLIAKVGHWPLYDTPSIAGINFGQKCLTRDEVFKKLVNCINE